jgi:hypothetical protein
MRRAAPTAPILQGKINLHYTASRQQRWVVTGKAQNEHIFPLAALGGLSREGLL